MVAEKRSPENQAAFLRRYVAWEAVFRAGGASLAYPYAWRLPSLARPAGAMAVAQAGWALALTLYTLGRFREALVCLSPKPHVGDERLHISILALRSRCRWLLGEELATPLFQVTGLDPTAQGERAYLAVLMDDPVQVLASCQALTRLAVSSQDLAWSRILNHWARARNGMQVDAAATHVELANLRRLAPALAAHAEALYAEACFFEGPAWANVWLDAALAQCERYGQHHIKARLLHRKALALEAVGQLHESCRFMTVARSLAQHQEAWRYFRVMTL